MTDLSRCPQCGGPADNGHDRELPPNPYLCTKCSQPDNINPLENQHKSNSQPVDDAEVAAIIRRLHECKRGLRNATPSDFNKWWRLLSGNHRALKVERAKVAELETALTAAIPFIGYQAHVPDILERCEKLVKYGEQQRGTEQ